MDMESGAERIVRSLVDVGPATAAVLAERLGVTPGAVRRHLDPMLDKGLLTAGDQAPYGPRTERGRGRPARVYAVTDAGREWLPKGYEALSVELLRFLRDEVGPDAVVSFATARLGDQRERYAAALE
ncbi:MAG: ArsR family transcriptional regulator, partial [Actinobacteria bacterium]|nr:ArsR family transcriptional regulator [Actinomycetota bacterium]